MPKLALKHPRLMAIAFLKHLIDRSIGKELSVNKDLSVIGPKLVSPAPLTTGPHPVLQDLSEQKAPTLLFPPLQRSPSDV